MQDDIKPQEYLKVIGVDLANSDDLTAITNQYGEVLIVRRSSNVCM